MKIPFFGRRARIERELRKKPGEIGLKGRCMTFLYRIRKKLDRNYVQKKNDGLAAQYSQQAHDVEEKVTEFLRGGYRRYDIMRFRDGLLGVSSRLRQDIDPHPELADRSALCIRQADLLEAQAARLTARIEQMR